MSNDRMRIKGFTMTLWLIVVMASFSVAFAQAPTTPKFEVASVKSASPDSKFMMLQPTPGGRLNITNLTLKNMIGSAWGVQPFQIFSGPAWIDSVRYDVSAKAEGAAKMPELMQMLRSLLADRFQLVIHRETKELPIFALVLARKDGKLGPQLVESKEGSCTSPDPTKPPAPPDPAKGPTLACGQLFVGIQQLRGLAISIRRLPPTLSRFLGRNVIDQTGLNGTYDVTLQWTPDDAQLAGYLPPGAPKPPLSDTAGPSIFAALQEQLGLKLEATKGPVEVLVIDQVERPDEN